MSSKDIEKTNWLQVDKFVPLSGSTRLESPDFQHCLSASIDCSFSLMDNTVLVYTVVTGLGAVLGMAVTAAYAWYIHTDLVIKAFMRCACVYLTRFISTERQHVLGFTRC